MIAQVALAVALTLASPSVKIDREDDLRRLHVKLPGLLISYALVDTAAGRQVVFLVAPQGEPVTPGDPAEPRLPDCPAEADEAAPLALYRLDPRDGQQLTSLRDDLPHDATMVDAADLDGDGIDELIIARPGELLEVPVEGAPRRLVEAEALRWQSVHPRAVRHPQLQRTNWVATTALGAFELFGTAAGEHGWKSSGRVELPIEGRLRSTSIQVWTPRSRFIGESTDGTLLFAVGPESVGDRRLKTLVISVDVDGVAARTESWARLPEAEEILDRGFLVIEDKPVLLVTTKPAGKLSLFGEKQLRLYPLDRDRSRLGLSPLFAADTRMNHWQDATPLLLDVNGDDREDLVLGYWKGLTGARVVLDVYLGLDAGVFDASPRSTGFDVKRGDRSFVQYGADLNGNGYPDLLVRGKDSLLLFAGQASRSGKKLVASKPRRLPLTKLASDAGEVVVQFSSDGELSTWGQTPLEGRPQIADIDGDGRVELILVRRGYAALPGFFRAFWIGPTSERPRSPTRE